MAQFALIGGKVVKSKDFSLLFPCVRPNNQFQDGLSKCTGEARDRSLAYCTYGSKFRDTL